MRRWRACALLLAVLASLLPLLRCQSVNSTAFTRAGAYDYKVCTDQPGEVPSTSASATPGGTSRCIAIDPGSLTFCASVSYVSCLRLPVAADYDALVSEAYTLRTTRLGLEFPKMAQSTCLSAFKSYFCKLSFPQCVAMDGEYVELPVCWSYCLQSQMACVTSQDLAEKACSMGVAAGRVAPDRPDVQCMSCAARAPLALMLALALALCAALT